MYEEFKLGDESKHAPYINYLKHQPRGLLPAEWSDAGRKLLEETIQGHSPQDSESESIKGGGNPTREDYHLKIILKNSLILMLESVVEKTHH